MLKRKTPLKRSNYKIKRTPLKKGGRIKVKKKSEEKILYEKTEAEKMRMFFLTIWESISRKNCWECGKWLGNEPLTIFFDHALEKSTRKDLKFEKENIFLCCGDCHSSKTAGFPGKKHQEFIDKVKKKFGEKADI